MGLVIADPAQIIITVGNDRRTLVGADRGQGVDHIRDLPRIVDDDLLGFLCTQIGEFLQHFIGCMQVEGGGILVGHTHALLDNGTVDFVLRIQEMHIACGDDGFPGLLSQAHDGAVEVQQVLLCLDLRIFGLHFGRFEQEAVVVARLDLQIIIEIHNTGQDLVRTVLKNSLHQFTHDTGASHEDPLPIFHQQALGNAGLFEKVGQV